MRHRKAINHLSRTSSHRKAMMSNMASSLIMHKRIKTTLAKAKALRVYVEPLITRSKEDTTHNRREVFSYLQDNKAVTELFRVVSQKVADRPGGYTRILKTGNRLGDNAEMCLIELVDFNELYVSDSGKQKGGKRTRRGGKRGAAEVVAGKVTPAVAAEKVKKSEVSDEEVIAEAPEVVEEEPVAEAPEVVEEEPVAEAPEVVEEEPVAEAPEVVEEEPMAEAPEVVEEEPVAEAPEVVEEEPVAEAPEVVEEEPVAEAPEVVEEEPVAEAPAHKDGADDKGGEEAPEDEADKNKNE